MAGGVGDGRDGGEEEKVAPGNIAGVESVDVIGGATDITMVEALFPGQRRPRR